MNIFCSIPFRWKCRRLCATAAILVLCSFPGLGRTDVTTLSQAFIHNDWPRIRAESHNLIDNIQAEGVLALLLVKMSPEDFRQALLEAQTLLVTKETKANDSLRRLADVLESAEGTYGAAKLVGENLFFGEWAHALAVRTGRKTLGLKIINVPGIRARTEAKKDLSDLGKALVSNETRLLARLEYLARRGDPASKPRRDEREFLQRHAFFRSDCAFLADWPLEDVRGAMAPLHSFLSTKCLISLGATEGLNIKSFLTPELNEKFGRNSHVLNETVAAKRIQEWENFINGLGQEKQAVIYSVPVDDGTPTAAGPQRKTPFILTSYDSKRDLRTALFQMKEACEIVTAPGRTFLDTSATKSALTAFASPSFWDNVKGNGWRGSESVSLLAKKGEFEPEKWALAPQLFQRLEEVSFARALLLDLPPAPVSATNGKVLQRTHVVLPSSVDGSLKVLEVNFEKNRLISFRRLSGGAGSSDPALGVRRSGDTDATLAWLGYPEIEDPQLRWNTRLQGEWGEKTPTPITHENAGAVLTGIQSLISKCAGK